MKTLFTFALLGLVFCRASAQVTVELEQEQDQFLPAEPMPLAVKITNRSGQKIHLGEEANWLTFSVEALDGGIVMKNDEVPVQGAFDLESSQRGIKRVDLAPHFQLIKPGRYKIIATMHIPDWTATVMSPPKYFNIVHGAKVWAQEFGVRIGSNTVPEVRKYTLEQANHLKSQRRLYVQLSDSDESRVMHTVPLGPMVSFAQPEAQIDPTSRLHVLWQSGAQSFSYCLLDPDGKMLRRETYDNFNSRPRLAVTTEGDVVVQGGTKRGAVEELPLIKAPEATTAEKK